MRSGCKGLGIESLVVKHHLLTILHGDFGACREVVVRMPQQQNSGLQVMKHIVDNAHSLHPLTVIGDSIGALLGEFLECSHDVLVLKTTTAKIAASFFRKDTKLK